MMEATTEDMRAFGKSDAGFIFEKLNGPLIEKFRGVVPDHILAYASETGACETSAACVRMAMRGVRPDLIEVYRRSVHSQLSARCRAAIIDEFNKLDNPVV
jgi:hypothetical protein